MGVFAESVVTAVVSADCTFVNVKADVAVALESFFASTAERTERVRAFAISRAGMSTGSAFVMVLTCDTVALEAFYAATRKAAHSVLADGLGAANVSARFALVYIGTFDAVALKTRFASAVKALGGIGTKRVLVAIVSAERTLVSVSSRRGCGRRSGRRVFRTRRSCGRKWRFNRPPNHVKAVKVGSGVGLELDVGNIGVERSPFEPALVYDIVEFAVSLVRVFVEEVRIVGRAGDSDLLRKGAEFIDVLTHLWIPRGRRHKSQKIPLAVVALAWRTPV